jgi:hypothetical protein
MKRHHFLFAVAVLSVLFFATTNQTQARNRSKSQRGHYGRSDRNNFMYQEQFRSTSRRVTLRVSAVTFSKRDLAKRIRASLKRCSCAAMAQDSDYSRGCFTGCLKDNGVSTVSLAACAAACAGNLVGCAVCLGVHEWIVLGCAQYCVWRDVISFEQGSVSNRPRPWKKRPAKRVVTFDQAA